MASKLTNEEMRDKLTDEEMRDFLSSGVDGAEWPKGKSIFWIIVDDCPKKYVYRRAEGGPHAEIRFINELKRGRRGHRQVETAQEIEIFCNYSPCDECADQLQRLVSGHSDLRITIKCAHLYRVEDDPVYSERNIAGLKSLKSAGIKVESFDGNDWSRLLCVPSNLWGYACLQPSVLVELGFSQSEAEKISTRRQAKDGAVRRKLQSL